MTFLFKSILLFGCILSSATTIFSQKTLTAIESVGKIKRREITYNENNSIIREKYFSSKDQQPLVDIEYYENGTIRKITGYEIYPKVSYFIDFQSGDYVDSNSNVFLKFVGNFVFNGRQAAKDISVNYYNGTKNGRFLQSDSVVFGKKMVIYDKVDTRYLKFDIIKFDKDVGFDPLYKVYKGLVLDFKNGGLEGRQTSYYGNASLKFDSYFQNNKLLKYTSFSSENALISKLETNDGISLGPQFLNGKLLDTNKSYLFYYSKLIEAGDIYYDSMKISEGSVLENELSSRYYFDGKDLRSFMKVKEFSRDSVYTFAFKNKFDSQRLLFSNSYIIKYLLNIPDFKIKYFIFDSEEDKAIEFVSFDRKNVSLDSFFNTHSDTLKDGYYFRYPLLRFYEYGHNNNTLSFLEPNFRSNYENNYDLRMIEMSSQKFAFYLRETYKIPNVFYLTATKYANSDYLERPNIFVVTEPSSINEFLNFFVNTMISNVTNSLVHNGVLRSPFNQKLFSSKQREGDSTFIRLLDIVSFAGPIVINNSMDKRTFKIYNRNKIVFSNGRCDYTFRFEGSIGSAYCTEILIDSQSKRQRIVPIRNVVSLVESDSGLIYQEPEIMAQYPKSMSENFWGHIMRYLQKNMNAIDREAVEGSIKYRLIVDENGNVTDASAVPCENSQLKKCLNDNSTLLKIGKDALMSSPKWESAKHGDKNVKSYYYITINFRPNS